MDLHSPGRQDLEARLILEKEEEEEVLGFQVTDAGKLLKKQSMDGGNCHSNPQKVKKSHIPLK